MLRAPADYVGLLEDAFDRAGIPGWFERGARRPHPAGRAFLAILGCAVERLSAIRFAEYLSLGQVPTPDEAARSAETSLPADDAVAGFARVEPPPDEREADEAAPPVADRRRTEPVVAGALRAPWRWEKLIVDSAVIGGDPRALAAAAARPARRVRGTAARGAARGSRFGASRPARTRSRQPRAPGRIRAAGHRHARVVAALPRPGASGSRSSAISRRGCCDARAGACACSASCGRWRAIGPVTLEEARGILAERLRTLDEQPPANRYGCVFVGTPQQLRGRVFKVVFVPVAGRAAVPADAARGSDAARRRDARAARRRPVRPGGSRSRTSA